MKFYKLFLLYSFFMCSTYAFAEDMHAGNTMEKNLVVITGVTKGLGLATAREFSKRGWKVAGCGRSTKNIEELQKEFGPDHLFSTVNISDDRSVAQWANEVSSKMGSPAILINNAALINEPNVLWKVPPSEFSDIMNTNVIGTFHVIHHFIPLMIRRGSGTIVNISSSSGVEGEKNFSPYCASKFAIEGLTQSLAQELPPGLITVALDPGGINTEMLHKAYPGEENLYPTAEQRAKILVPFILNLSSKNNGKHIVITE